MSREAEIVETLVSALVKIETLRTERDAAHTEIARLRTIEEAARALDWDSVIDGLDVAVHAHSEMEVNKERWRADENAVLALCTALEGGSEPFIHMLAAMSTGENPRLGVFAPNGPNPDPLAGGPE